MKRKKETVAAVKGTKQSSAHKAHMHFSNECTSLSGNTGLSQVQRDTRLKTKISICMLTCSRNFHLSGKIEQNVCCIGVVYFLQTDHHLIQQRNQGHIELAGLHCMSVHVAAILNPTCHIRWSCSSGLSGADLLLLAHWLHTLPQTLAKHLGKFIHTTPSTWSSHSCLLASSWESLCLSLLHLFSFIYYQNTHRQTSENIKQFISCMYIKHIQRQPGHKNCRLRINVWIHLFIDGENVCVWAELEWNHFT